MAKSSSSQYIYREVSVESAILDTIEAPSQEDQQYLELRDALFQKVLHIIEHDLTPKQRLAIVLCYLQGKTQYEAADLMGVHQTSVFYHIHGGSNGAPNKSGGALRKIRKVLDRDQEAQLIIMKLKEVENL
jgi:DNA-directed RNA polymerase specialized sigma subunit